MLVVFTRKTLHSLAHLPNMNFLCASVRSDQPSLRQYTTLICMIFISNSDRQTKYIIVISTLQRPPIINAVKKFLITDTAFFTQAAISSRHAGSVGEMSRTSATATDVDDTEEEHDGEESDEAEESAEGEQDIGPHEADEDDITVIEEIGEMWVMRNCYELLTQVPFYSTNSINSNVCELSMSAPLRNKNFVACKMLLHAVGY